MNQFSFFGDIDDNQMCRLVVKELKNYKALCVRMKNQEEQEKRRKKKEKEQEEQKNPRKESVYKLVRLYLEILVKQGGIKEIKGR